MGNDRHDFLAFMPNCAELHPGSLTCVQEDTGSGMEKDILQMLTRRARPLSRTVVFPDSLDVRTLRAAAALRESGAVRPVLVGDAQAIAGLAGREDLSLDGVAIENPATSAHLPRLAGEFASMGGDQSPGTLNDPLVFSGMMVRCGLADGSVAGSLSRTSDVIRAALRTIGLRQGVGKLSSYFLMLFPGRILAFADCAVQPDPAAAELAEIARLAADNFSMITGTEPVVAFLSFSTKGSAEHASVHKVREAVKIFRDTGPAVAADGELQFDAAIDTTVASLKAPDSPVAGRANVFVFPDLDAGNIGYKIAQRLGGAEALGPLLQGLARPAFDLSRGCTERDIVLVSLINALSAV